MIARRKGFTLIECMFAMLLLAIVLPAINLGLASATKAAGSARSRTEAAGLAQSKVAELISIAQTQQLSGTNLSGDFGTDWPDYRWNAAVANWQNDPQPVGMQQLDVTITWPAKGPQQSLVISTLIYVRP